MHVKKRFIYWQMSRCAWEELCKHLFCCHFLQCNSHFNLTLNQWCSKKISPAGLHFEAALKAPYSDTGVPSQGFKINFGYCTNIKREQHESPWIPMEIHLDQTAKLNIQYPMEFLHCHLPIPYVWCLPTACRVCPAKLSGRAHGALPASPYLSSLTSCLCLPTTSEMLAGPLTLCFCPASGPDTGCPLAHNPPPGFSSDLRAPSLSGPLQALHFPLVPSYRVWHPYKWASWGLEPCLFTFHLSSPSPKEVLSQHLLNMPIKGTMAKNMEVLTLSMHSGDIDMTAICPAHLQFGWQEFVRQGRGA